METPLIEWRGEVLADIGYGIGTRRLLKPIIEMGVNVKLVPAEDYIPEDRRINDPFWLEQIAKSKEKPDGAVQINFCIPPVAALNPKAVKRVIYAMWETDKYPKEWVPAMSAADAFFVGTKSLEASAKKAGLEKPVYTVEHTLDSDFWCPGDDKLTLSSVPDSDVVFTYIANWLPRKNFADLLTAFCCEFTGVKDVTLILKTWGPNNADFRNGVTHKVREHAGALHHIERPNIQMITDVLPEEAILKLLRRTDVYISPSHGEGFDLPLAQAMACECLPVANNFLAHGDYLTEENSILYKHSLVPVYNAGVPHYAADQRWARPDVCDMMRCMRKAYDSVKSGTHTSLVKKARATVVDSFNPEKCSRKLLDIVEILASGN